MFSVKWSHVLLLMIALLLFANILMPMTKHGHRAYPQEVPKATAPLPQYKLLEYNRIANMEKDLNKHIEQGWRLDRFGASGGDENMQYYALLVKDR